MRDTPDTEDAQREPVDGHIVPPCSFGAPPVNFSRPPKAKRDRRLVERRSLLVELSIECVPGSELLSLRRQQREPNGGRTVVLILTAVSIRRARIAVKVYGKRALSTAIEQSTRRIGKVSGESQRTRADASAGGRHLAQDSQRDPKVPIEVVVRVESDVENVDDVAPVGVMQDAASVSIR